MEYLLFIAMLLLVLFLLYMLKSNKLEGITKYFVLSVVLIITFLLSVWVIIMAMVMGIGLLFLFLR